MSNEDRIDRRQFTRRLAAGTTCAASAAATIALAADVPPAPKLPEDPAAAPAEPPPELLLLSYVVRTWPSENFDDAAVQGIFRDIRGDVARGEVLSDFPLKNSDEPAFAFRAFRSPDGRPAE